MKITKGINENLFREYDLRGIAQDDIQEDVAYTIGKSFGSYIQKTNNYKAIVGHDNRLSSPAIHKALIRGIIDSGVSVIDLGLVTTPMYYYAKIYYNIYTGIMITASHNPKEYNGFKISFSKIGNAYGPLIDEFKKFTYAGKFIDGHGQIEKANIKSAYLQNFKKCIDLGNRKIKVVVDCGNGTGSIIIKEVLDMFNVDYELLYCQSDGNFPHHIADPAVSENMVDLGKKVIETGADFGIGIDGDADRVGVVTETGKYITSDLLMLIIYRSIASTMKEKKALFDVKCSKTLIDGLKAINIKPIMNRTGNSYCNLKMQEGDFSFGGEYSGHFFFRDKYQGFDDGIYAGIRIIEILSKNDKKFSQLLDNINKYYSTEEIKIKVREDNKFQIVEEVKKYVISKKYDYNDMDGVRVEFIDGFALVRASNTGPNLTMRFEAKTKERLNQIQKEFETVVKNIIEKN